MNKEELVALSQFSNSEIWLKILKPYIMKIRDDYSSVMGLSKSKIDKGYVLARIEFVNELLNMLKLIDEATENLKLQDEKEEE